MGDDNTYIIDLRGLTVQITVAETAVPNFLLSFLGIQSFLGNGFPVVTIFSSSCVQPAVAWWTVLDNGQRTEGGIYHFWTKVFRRQRCLLLPVSVRCDDEGDWAEDKRRRSQNRNVEEWQLPSRNLHLLCEMGDKWTSTLFGPLYSSRSICHSSLAQPITQPLRHGRCDVNVGSFPWITLTTIHAQWPALYQLCMQHSPRSLACTVSRLTIALQGRDDHLRLIDAQSASLRGEVTHSGDSGRKGWSYYVN